MNIVQENPPFVKHPKFNELMFPGNVHDEKHIERIKEGYEKQRQHQIKKLKTHMSAVFNHHPYNTKFLHRDFKGLFKNDPDYQYKIFSVPLPQANA